jgi:hypothetical protein
VRSSLRTVSQACAESLRQRRPLQFTVVLRIPDHECDVAEADQSGRITSAAPAAGRRSPQQTAASPPSRPTPVGSPALCGPARTRRRRRWCPRPPGSMRTTGTPRTGRRRRSPARSCRCWPAGRPGRPRHPLGQLRHPIPHELVGVAVGVPGHQVRRKRYERHEPTVGGYRRLCAVVVGLLAAWAEGHPAGDRARPNPRLSPSQLVSGRRLADSSHKGTSWRVT